MGFPKGASIPFGQIPQSEVASFLVDEVRRQGQVKNYENCRTEPERVRFRQPCEQPGDFSLTRKLADSHVNSIWRARQESNLYLGFRSPKIE